MLVLSSCTIWLDIWKYSLGKLFMQIWSLLSSSYSGSTLLSMLLSSYPRTLGFGDTYNYQYVEDINDTRCACGMSPSYQCPVRMDIVDRMKRSGYKGFDWVYANPKPLFSFLRDSRFSIKVSRSHYLARVYKHLPDFIRLLVFRRFYIENHEFFSAIENIGDYDYYFDGSNSLLEWNCLGRNFQVLRSFI